MDLLDSMLDLMRRLPPTQIEANVATLVQICPDYADDLLGSVDQPLKLLTDPTNGKDYLACDYNRDGESYRSPWSNEYDPPLDDGTKPSPRLRKLEVAANEAFDTYREMYFDGGVSSVFLWDLEHDGGFAGVVLLKKVLNGEHTGAWDSIHVFEASERGRTAHYKLTSTVMLHLVAAPATTTPDAQSEITLSGSMTRQTEQDAPLADALSHVANVGRMIEDMEIKMRNLLQEVYFGKTKDVVFDLRSTDSLARQRQQRALQRELVGLMKK
ncbi:F-actin capping protein beta subunit [Auricularia subglabra TFB-10046 SS5]|nr:F-actin capping protein beta subunit [Auricularia subglabra TFB-10046 SS5]